MRRQQGISLVELMVALVIGLVISGVVVQVMVSNKTTYLVQESANRLQESGRLGLQLLAREIRAAGAGGTMASIDVVCVAKDCTGAHDLMYTSGIYGEQADGSKWGAVKGSDIIHITQTDGDCDAWVSDTEKVTVSNANIEVTELCDSMVDGAMIMIMDPSKAAIFAITNVTVTGKVVKIVHAGNVNISPKLPPFGSDARVVGFSSKALFIRDTGEKDATGKPVHALSLRVNNQTPAQPLDLLDGVESMVVLYGMPATTTSGKVDEYFTAAQIDALEANVSDPRGWSDVRSVKVNLLLVSDVAVPGAQDQAISFNGAAVAEDGRLRREVSTVIALRNRTL